MKRLLLLAMIILISACSSTQEKYPYGMSEKEWNELSIKDKAAIRRDFYFYERGNMNFVNPQLQVEGQKHNGNVFMKEKDSRKTPEPLI